MYTLLQLFLYSGKFFFVDAAVLDAIQELTVGPHQFAENDMIYNIHVHVLELFGYNYAVVVLLIKVHKKYLLILKILDKIVDNKNTKTLSCSAEVGRKLMRVTPGQNRILRNTDDESDRSCRRSGGGEKVFPRDLNNVIVKRKRELMCGRLEVYLYTCTTATDVVVGCFQTWESAIG